MATVALTGNLTVGLTEDARPAPVPINISMTYSKKQMYDFSHSGAVTNSTIPQGTVTAPRFAFVQVTSGSAAFSWASDGAGGLTLTANATPPPADVPSLLMFTFSTASRQLYITTTGAATGRVWLFE